MSCPAAICSAPTSSTSSRCSSRCRPCSSRPWRPRCRSRRTPSDRPHRRGPPPRLLKPRPGGLDGSTGTDGGTSSSAAGGGASWAVAGLSTSVPIVLGCVAIAEGADTVSAALRGSSGAPDHGFGTDARSTMLIRRCCPTRSDSCGQVLRAIADRWSVRTSITSGGVLCVVGVLATAAWLRDFWSYDARTDPYAVAERERRAAAGRD